MSYIDEPYDPGDGGSYGGSYPPIVLMSSFPNGAIGTVYSQVLQAAYGTGGYTWAITAGSLPAGLSLASSTGTISGTPTTSGTTFFVAQVTDSAGSHGAANLSISIPTQPTIANTSVPAATVGVPYNAAFSGQAGASPYTFAVTAGSLPPGLALASTGGITGTPTAQGTYFFSVTVTDSAAPQASSSANFSITVQRASLSSTVRALDQCVLLGSSDGAVYMVVPGQRHDEDYYGQPVGIFQEWYGVPTPSGKLNLSQLGGATVSARGAGALNVSAIDDIGGETVLSTERRPMMLTALEQARDFMAKAVPKSVRYAPRLHNGGVVDAWFEAHIFILWMRAFWSGRKA